MNKIAKMGDHVCINLKKKKLGGSLPPQSKSPSVPGYNSAVCLLLGNTQHGTINKREWKNREQKEMGSIFYFPSHFHASFYFFWKCLLTCQWQQLKCTYEHKTHTHGCTCSFILSYIYTHRISNTSETISKPQIRKYQF